MTELEFCKKAHEGLTERNKKIIQDNIHLRAKIEQLERTISEMEGEG